MGQSHALQRNCPAEQVPIYCISGLVAALLHGIGAAKYESDIVSDSSSNEICQCWHSYF